MAGDSIRRLRAGIVALALDAGRVDAVFVTPPFETIAKPNAACRSQPRRLTHPRRPALASVATSDLTAGPTPIRPCQGGKPMHDRFTSGPGSGFAPMIARLRPGTPSTAASADRRTRAGSTDCAVLAMPGRTAGFSGGTGQDVTLTNTRTATSAVVVHATKPDYEVRHSVLRDASFDIAAIC